MSDRILVCLDCKYLIDDGNDYGFCLISKDEIALDYGLEDEPLNWCESFSHEDDILDQGNDLLGCGGGE